LSKVKAKIKNTGEENMLDSAWSLDVKGGLFGRVNITKEGFIDKLESGQTAAVSTYGIALKSRIVRRIGRIDVTLKVDMYGKTFVEHANGIVIGRIVFLFGN
jgi:hypothetical protein